MSCPDLKVGLVEPLIIGYDYYIGRGALRTFYLRIKCADKAKRGRELFIAEIMGLEDCPEPMNILPEIPFIFTIDSKEHYFMVQKANDASWSFIEYSV